jgi:hypothetical protein
MKEYRNPVKRYTPSELKEFAMTMCMGVSPNAGKMIEKKCLYCGAKVAKRYHIECNACHAKRK